MAVVTPLKLDGSNNLIAMSSTDIANIKLEMIRQYGLSPSVTLAYSAGTGNLPAISDTRYQAGAAILSNTAFAAEATTAEPTQVTVNYQNVLETFTSLAAPADTSNVAFPVYLTGANQVQAMSLTDMYDTFVNDVITTLTTNSFSTSQAGTYTVHTANTLAGATLINASPIFTDTRADTTLYTDVGMPETLDQPITITNYYLFRVDGASVGTIPTPLQALTNGNLQQYTTAAFQTLLQNLVRYYAANVVGAKIDYNITTSATGGRGSGMVNTDFTSVTGAYTTLQTGDNYYAQEFPNGTVSTIATNYLNCLRV
jgi:hypothetical protein